MNSNRKERIPFYGIRSLVSGRWLGITSEWLGVTSEWLGVTSEWLGVTSAEALTPAWAICYQC